VRHEPELTPPAAETADVNVRVTRRGAHVTIPVAAISAVIAALVGVGSAKLAAPDANAAPAVQAPADAAAFRALNERLDRIEGEQRGLRTDVGEIRGDVRGLRSEIRSLRKAAD
jgi:hypothetical protein